MKTGFTLAELVMIIAILAIVVAGAIPLFQNMVSTARLSATKGILGEVRAAIAIYRSNELSGGSSGTFGGFAAIGQVCDQSDNGVGVCIGTLNPKVMTNGFMPNNPFAGKGLNASHFTSPSFYNNVGDGSLLTAGTLQTSGSGLNVAWWYKRSTGQFWPNTNNAGEKDL